MGKLQKLANTVRALGAAGTVVAGCLVFDDSGVLQQFRLGPLAIFDRRRMEARRARRRARKRGESAPP